MSMKERYIMSKSYKFSQTQIEELQAARKKNKNKKVDKRLEALLLRASDVKREIVAKKTGFSKQYITDLTAKYHNEGLASITENHYKGNHRNLSWDEEEALLRSFDEAAEKGQIVEVSAIKRAYEEMTGKDYSKAHGIIYDVMKRHGFRRVMPRSKHPKSASPEAVEASKKLRLQ